MDRQLRLSLEENVIVPVSLSEEVREELVALMADAIVAVLEQRGGNSDEQADAQRED